VDHVNYGPQFPPTGAYDSAAFTILGNVATLATNAILGEKVATVTFPVNTDRAAPRQRSQFRLRFSAADTNTDGNPTFVRFQDAEQGGGGGSVPLLIVTYDVPN
jgi:hypothetical protein